MRFTNSLVSARAVFGSLGIPILIEVHAQTMRKDLIALTPRRWNNYVKYATVVHLRF